MINQRLLGLLPDHRRLQLLAVATITGIPPTSRSTGARSRTRSTTTWVSGPTGPHRVLGEGGSTLAADLMRADGDPRPAAAGLLDRAIAALPPGVGKVQCRWDSGYFAVIWPGTASPATSTSRSASNATPRSGRACRIPPKNGWHPAIGMAHTEVAVIEYLPGSWPADAKVSCIARRTRIPVELIPTNARARKLRTIDKDQLALALAGQIDHDYGYSFILTNLDVSTPTRLAQIEHWYRHRTDIEALNKDAKHGAALRHLPSKDRTVNTVWMWAALLACAISTWIQELAGLDNGRGRMRRTVARLRRELINIPARIIRTNRAQTLRPPPRPGLLIRVLNRLQTLPTIRTC